MQIGDHGPLDAGTGESGERRLPFWVILLCGLQQPDHARLEEVAVVGLCRGEPLTEAVCEELDKGDIRVYGFRR